MSDNRWPHHGVPGGWEIDPNTNQVHTNTSNSKSDLAKFAAESRSYLAARDQALEEYLEALRFVGALKGRSSTTETSLERPLTATDARLALSGSRTITIMKKGKMRRKRLGRKRPRNGALRGRNLPFRMAFPIASSAGIYQKTIDLGAAIVEYVKTFDEFRCMSFRAKFVSSAITAEGVYTAILLDSEGFGSIPANGAQTDLWFRRIGDMPGSIMRHCAGGFTVSWKPTEPSAKEWRRGSVKFNLATVYVVCSSEATNIKGAIHIIGTVKCRGEYYGAISRVRRLSLAISDLQDEDLEDTEVVTDFEKLSAK